MVGLDTSAFYDILITASLFFFLKKKKMPVGCSSARMEEQSLCCLLTYCPPLETCSTVVTHLFREQCLKKGRRRAEQRRPRHELIHKMQDVLHNVQPNASLQNLCKTADFHIH